MAGDPLPRGAPELRLALRSVLHELDSLPVGIMEIASRLPLLMPAVTETGALRRTPPRALTRAHTSSMSDDERQMACAHLVRLDADAVTRLPHVFNEFDQMTRRPRLVPVRHRELGNLNAGSRYSNERPGVLIITCLAMHFHQVQDLAVPLDRPIKVRHRQAMMQYTENN